MFTQITTYNGCPGAFVYSKAFVLTWYCASTWYSLPAYASTAVCCAGRPAACYRAAREPLPRVPTAFQVSKCVRGGLSGSTVPS